MRERSISMFVLCIICLALLFDRANARSTIPAGRLSHAYGSSLLRENRIAARSQKHADTPSAARAANSLFPISELYDTYVCTRCVIELRTAAHFNMRNRGCGAFRRLKYTNAYLILFKKK